MTQRGNVPHVSYSPPNATHRVGVRVPDVLMAVAAKALGLPPDTAPSIIVRTALANVAGVEAPAMSRGRRTNYSPTTPLEDEVAA